MGGAQINEKTKPQKRRGPANQYILYISRLDENGKPKYPKKRK